MEIPLIVTVYFSGTSSVSPTYAEGVNRLRGRGEERTKVWGREMQGMVETKNARVQGTGDAGMGKCRGWWGREMQVWA